MVKPLLGGQTMLNEFNKRGKNETNVENFVGGHIGESVYAEELNFNFSAGSEPPQSSNWNRRDFLCNDGGKSTPREDFITNKNSPAYKHNQDKINDQVGVDASRRLHRLNVKQNLINNDCPSTILATGTIPTNSEFIKDTCSHNCSSCGLGYKKKDFKPHTQQNGLYERYYLKLGRSMFTDEERAACKLNCRCDTDLNWNSTTSGKARVLPPAVDGDGAGIPNISDLRVKENIKKVGIDLDTTLSLYEFNFKKDFGDPTKRWCGVIAQEVQMKFPNAVSKSSDGILSVNYHALNIDFKIVS